ncbi:alpha-L-arabinofuranosidase C-terminal domain-containing protein [Sphingobacterium bambusae]|uniref:non-reducing end alpha-L-arabinofuranosidase n=1 Tax=Sphingobacterium bambusae TaxID=662858 RepID=A0ABW6BIA4_9SPHI|nr:alpha-L-arabinofuranosidase C-terminal domain-containing protein [Sphingobacterium bambusae]WPL50553.1 alpha-L-arabinofuranosidase C-terminal domain-containing protein [Sphingobacterium bambusae]
MNNRIVVIYFILLSFCSMGTVVHAATVAEPDSVYLLLYAKAKNEGRDGLCYAWSLDAKQWTVLHSKIAFVKSDYGRWGSEKRMIDPVLWKNNKGEWSCVWSLNGDPKGPYAYTATADFVHWGRQTYYPTLADMQRPTLQELEQLKKQRIEVVLNDEKVRGSVLKVAWPLLRKLLDAHELATFRAGLWSERSIDDEQRFADLSTVNVSVKPNPQEGKDITDMLVGVFFEDLNYAADGGLYAELLQNRDFEYQISDKLGRDTTWNASKSWSTSGDLRFQIDSVQPIHPNNPHYATIEGSGTLSNAGFDGIAIQKDACYDLSFFCRSEAGSAATIKVILRAANGQTLATGKLKVKGKGWQKYGLTLTAVSTDPSAHLELSVENGNRMALDMVSLFPQDTFRGRKNGLRRDLAEAIADLNPRFVRFPGGCLAHGDGIENIYQWSKTIGPLEARVPQRNMWGYHQTAGLGYYEYFQFCEDIGAAPIPVVAAGVPCQNSHAHGHPLGGQQCGIPLEDMDEYVQEVLDLIEWANGDKNSKWGKLRAAAGHPEPFNLRFIGVGNEDLISDVFEERFTMIYEAVRAKYPNIQVIGTAGPFFEGTDYVEGWEIADKLQVPVMDEHYYQTPGWFIHNQDFYDKYDRSKSQVYLGEYAAHVDGRASNLEVALAEAIYLTALERNADIVKMTSYAPLLAKEGFTQWRPDLIYFSNTDLNLSILLRATAIWGKYGQRLHTYICTDRSDERRRTQAY